MSYWGQDEFELESAAYGHYHLNDELDVAQQWPMRPGYPYPYPPSPYYPPPYPYPPYFPQFPGMPQITRRITKTSPSWPT